MPLNFFKQNKRTSTPVTQSVEFTKGMFSDKAMKKRYDAALEFLGEFQNRMPLVNGYPHAGTALSIVSRLAGTSLFRAINKGEYEVGQVILSKEVNDAFPKLLKLFAHYCKKSGVDVEEKPAVAETPEKDKPLMDIAQVQAEYQLQYNQVMKKHGLDYLEGALTGMVIASIIFKYHSVDKNDIDPYVATGIVARGVIEGSKSTPVSLNEKKAKEHKLPAGPLGKTSRFVVGELAAVIEDVGRNGGQYTQLNPMIEAKLRESNIDPKLVYIKGLESQLQEKVERVDFIQLDVDTALKQAANDKATIPIYLAHWMHANAEKHGYKREGNSWVLQK